MSQGRAPRRRRSGLLSSNRAGKSDATPLWHWFVGIPVLLLMIGLLGVFVWINFFHPDVGMGIETATLPVVSRGADPGGFGSSPRPWLAVTLDGKELHLPATAEQAAAVRTGERVVVRYRREAGRTMVMGWNRAARAAPAAPPGD